MPIGVYKRIKKRGGWKLSQETKDKIRRSSLGRKFSEETREKIREKLLGHKHSQETRRKISESQKGRPKPGNSREKSHWWKGGTTELNKVIRESLQYKNWRESIFGRDKYTCKLCGVKGVRMIVDHIKALYVIRDENNIKSFADALNCEELWDLSNGRTLCDSCHVKTENYGRPKNDLKKSNAHHRPPKTRPHRSLQAPHYP